MSDEQLMEQLRRGTLDLHSKGVVMAVVGLIGRSAIDDERAHSLEDEFNGQVLAQIANGRLSGDDAKEAARASVEISQIAFSRWCA